jgi:hypothetical protein
MITCIIIYLLIGIALTGFCAGITKSQMGNLGKLKPFRLLLLIIFYPIIFIYYIFETLGERY